MAPFNAARLKVQLKLSSNRLRMLQQKKNAQNAAYRLEISKLLEKHKIDSARIRVEHVIREDFNMEALEITELYCEMLLARFGVIEQMKELDPSIQEAVYSLCYAAQRVEATELMSVREQLISKYGKYMDMQAIQAKENNVSAALDKVNGRGVRAAQLLEKLKVRPPDPKLVHEYLRAIATSFNVEYIGGDSEELPAGNVDMRLAGPPIFQPLPETGVPPPGGRGPPPSSGGNGYPRAQGAGGGDFGESYRMPPPSGGPMLPYPVGLAAHPQGPGVDDMANMFPSVPTYIPRPSGGGGSGGNGGNNGGGGGSGGGGDEEEDDGAAMDELSRRLESLKGRAARA